MRWSNEVDNYEERIQEEDKNARQGVKVKESKASRLFQVKILKLNAY